MRAHMPSYIASPGERENDGPRTGPAAHHHDARTLLERVLDFLLGLRGILQADVGRREQSALRS